MPEKKYEKLKAEREKKNSVFCCVYKHINISQ